MVIVYPKASVLIVKETCIGPHGPSTSSHILPSPNIDDNEPFFSLSFSLSIYLSIYVLPAYLKTKMF